MAEITGKYIQINQYRIYYETAGEGRTIVCVPTAGASTGEYRHLLDNLSDKYRVIALDPPGHGNSYPDMRDLSVPTTLDAYVDFVWDFVQTLELEMPILVGCAASGSYMLYLASKHGNQVGAVVATEGNCTNMMNSVQLSSFNHPSINMHDLMQATTPGLCGSNATQEIINECIWHNARNAACEVMEADLSIYDNFDITEALKQITCPVLHIFGEYDYTVSDHSKKTILERVKKVKQVELKGTGHYVPIENPEGYRSEIEYFLREYQM